MEFIHFSNVVPHMKLLYVKDALKYCKYFWCKNQNLTILVHETKKTITVMAGNVSAKNETCWLRPSVEMQVTITFIIAQSVD